MKAIGIDLGTTNSVAAIDEGTGVPRVLVSRTGEQATPSVVSFSQKQKALLIGRSAWNNAETDPADTVFSIKRLMGRPFDDEHVGRVRKTYPYAVVPADNPDDRGVRVIINGVRYTPEDVSAMILRQIVEDAASALGEPVTHAVITVPAYFNEVQREATRTAGEKAGLAVKKIIDEPTAAAIAFGMDRTEEEHTLLVFDMGGGTLDVSLLYAYNCSFSGMAIAGDMWLGGDDFDREIVGMIVEWFKHEYKVDPSDDKRFLMLARRQAERAKHDLTQAEEAALVIPGAFSLPGGLPATVNMKITRAAFEARISSYIERSMELVKQVLHDKNKEPAQISAVLLVGGSTYIPFVRRSLEKIFGPGKVKDYVNPMNAVALGAAILSAQLEGNTCPKCETVNSYDATACVSCGAHLQGLRTDAIELTEITERSFGIGVVEQGQPDVYSPLIKARTPYPLPVPMGDTFYTRGHKIVIPVYVGDDPVASHNEYLGLVEYELPPSIPIRTPVTVQFNYDRDRILRVRVKIEGTDVDYEVTPKRHAPDPGAATAGKWRVAIQNAIASGRSMIEEYGDFVEPEQKKTLEDDICHAQDALRDQDATTGHQALVKLQETEYSLEIASRLWLVDRLIYDVEPRTAQSLAELSKNLRDAYRARDAGQVNRLRRALDSAINSILESLKLPTDGILPDLLERISVTERAGTPRS